MPKKAFFANSATLAAIIQKSTGKLPPFKSKNLIFEKDQALQRQAAAKEAAKILCAKPSCDIP
ncbi:MAG: hypothetical protein QW275_02070, partial [Candidatus Anstonellaceae archaeon]